MRCAATRMERLQVDGPTSTASPLVLFWTSLSGCKGLLQMAPPTSERPKDASASAWSQRPVTCIVESIITRQLPSPALLQLHSARCSAAMLSVDVRAEPFDWAALTTTPQQKHSDTRWHEAPPTWLISAVCILSSGNHSHCVEMVMRNHNNSCLLVEATVLTPGPSFLYIRRCPSSRQTHTSLTARDTSSVVSPPPWPRSSSPARRSLLCDPSSSTSRARSSATS